MSLSRTAKLCAVLAIVTGCKTVGLRPTVKLAVDQPSAEAPAPIAVATDENLVTPVAYDDEALPSLELPRASSAPDKSDLDLAALVADVQARNPSIDAMVAAWQSAAQRFPQA